MLNYIKNVISGKTANRYDVYVFQQGRWERRHSTLALSKREAFKRIKGLYDQYGMGYLPLAVVRREQ